MTWSIRTADVVRDGSGDVVGIQAEQVVWSGTSAVRGIDFSRDATRLVASIQNGTSFDLMLLDLGSGSVESLTATAENDAWPRWSPVDDRITFLRRSGSTTAISSVLTIHAATRSVTTVLAGASSLYASDVGGAVAWSPDGRQILTLLKDRKALDLWQLPSTGGKGVNVTTAVGAPPMFPCWGW